MLEPVLLEEKFKQLQRFVWGGFEDQHNGVIILDDEFRHFAPQLHRKMPKLSASGVLRVHGEPIKVCQLPTGYNSTNRATE